MPRPNSPRTLGCEADVSRRVADERSYRGWTYDGLARRVTDAGCPIHASAIYKIEKGTPRRRISVDELVGFASAFGLPVTALLETPEQTAERQVRELVAQLEALLGGLKPEDATRIRLLVYSPHIQAE
jgi:transcriptional regulator with XRE-family HTH domain